MALMMDSHPQVASVGETAIKPAIRRKRKEGRQPCSCGRLVHECPFWLDVFKAVAALGETLGPGQWNTDYRYEHPLLHRVLTRHSSVGPARRLQKLAARLLPGHTHHLARVDAVNRAFVRAVLQVSRAQVFFDTSKRAVRLSRFLAMPDFDVRVLHLVRDARAYAASEKRRGESVHHAAQAWRKDHEVIQDLTGKLPAERVMRLRYEDLCADPAARLREVYAFCGVEPADPPAFVSAAEHHVLGNKMRLNDRITIRLDETWRERLSAAEQSTVLSVAGELNQRFGYA
jgi:hypothetical protein